MIGQFVQSKELADLGIGKILNENGGQSVIEFFDSPTSADRPAFTVESKLLSRVKLDLQTRVQFP